ncbi:hypothetical protein ACWIX0_11640, partial [Helicobacter sp. T3_23-1059]
MKNRFKPQRFRIFESGNKVIIDIEKSGFTIDINELLPKINAITKDKKQSLQEYDIAVIFMGHHLTGGSESSAPYEDCFFGEMDSSSNDLDESKPIYYLEYDEADLDSSDSNKSYKSNVVSNHSNNSTNTNDSTQTNNKTKIYPTNQTLQIFLNNHKLTIINYSI